MKKLMAFILSLILTLASMPALSAKDIPSYFETSKDFQYALYVKGEKVYGTDNEKSLPVGSISKMFTAISIMKLREEGKISLDQKVYECIPEFVMNDERYKDITIRSLLDHTSGIFGSTLKNVDLYGEKSTWNHDNILNMLSEQRLKYAPGKMANYCNDGYALLEILIEKVTGENYTDYILENILTPLSLKSIYTTQDYTGDIKEYVNSIGAGGLFSNADDLCIFADAITSDKGFLSMESIYSMSEGNDSPYNVEGFSFGLGWDDTKAEPFYSSGIKALVKSGDTTLYHSALICLPEFNISCAVISDSLSSLYCQSAAKSYIMKYLSENALADIIHIESGDIESIDGYGTNECEKYEGVYLSNRAQYSFEVEGGKGKLKNLYTGKIETYAYFGGYAFVSGKDVLYFEEKDEKIYMKKTGSYSLSENEEYMYNDYIGEKKEIGENVFESWKKRDGKIYFILDEGYNSMLYTTSIPLTSVYFKNEVPNYLGYMKLVSENEAKSDIELPGTYGRDLTDLVIFEKDGIEYAKAQGWTFIDSFSVNEIYQGEKSICTILENGYTRWFKTGNLQNKNISVRIEGKGMYALYNSSGICTYSSVIKEGESILSQGGYIAFAGDKATRFYITVN